MVVVVLGWWLDAMLRLVSGSTVWEKVNFMEGPYAVEVSMVPSGNLRFRAVENSGRTRELAKGEGSAAVFCMRLLSHSRDVLDECKRQGWWSRDAERMERSLEELRGEVLRLNPIA
jgi:hypothetical protein